MGKDMAFGMHQSVYVIICVTFYKPWLVGGGWGDHVTCSR
jgi:hypothetical protein